MSKINDDALQAVMGIDKSICIDPPRYRWNPVKCIPLVIIGWLFVGVLSGLAMAPFVVWVLK